MGHKVYREPPPQAPFAHPVGGLQVGLTYKTHWGRLPLSSEIKILTHFVRWPRERENVRNLKTEKMYNSTIWRES